MNFFRNSLIQNWMQSLPYFFIGIVFLLNGTELAKSLKLGFETIDNMYLIYLYLLLSFVFVFSLLFLTSGRIDLTSVIFVCASLAINSLINGYSFELIESIGFIFALGYLIFFICSKLRFQLGYIEKLLLTLVANFVLLNGCLMLGIQIGNYIKFVSFSALFLYLIILSKIFFRKQISFAKIRFFRIHKFSISWFDFVFLVLTVMMTACILMLLNQPIFEWDSAVGHIPTMNYYLEKNALTPNPYQIQSYFINFHHISALPFFKMLGLRGLKFYNLLQVLLLIVLVREIVLLLNGESKLNQNGRFVYLSIVSVPLLISQVGSFQYDVSITAIFGFSLFFLFQLILKKGGDGHVQFFFILLSVIIGIYTKVNYISVAFPVMLLSTIFYFKYKMFSVRSFLFYLIVVLISIAFILLKSYFYTGTFFMPYSQILAHNSDWNEYGLTNVNIFWKTIYYIFGYTFSDKYGGYYLYAGGFIYLVAYISSMFRITSLKLYLSFIIIFAIFISVISTQYARYYIYFLSFFPLILTESRQTKSGSLYWLRNLILCVIVLYQILVLPRMNWWIKLDGSSLFAGYSPERHESAIRGPDYLDFKSLILNIKNDKTLALLPDFAVRYYYISKEQNTSIIPFTWQANVYHLFEESDRIPQILEEEGFRYVFIPTKSQWQTQDPFFEYYGIIDREFEFIVETTQFRLYRIF